MLHPRRPSASLSCLVSCIGAGAKGERSRGLCRKRSAKLLEDGKDEAAGAGDGDEKVGRLAAAGGEGTVKVGVGGCSCRLGLGSAVRTHAANGGGDRRWLWQQAGGGKAASGRPRTKSKPAAKRSLRQSAPPLRPSSCLLLQHPSSGPRP